MSASSLPSKQGQPSTYSPLTTGTSRRRLGNFLSNIAPPSSPFAKSRTVPTTNIGESPLSAKIYRHGAQRGEMGGLGGSSEQTSDEAELGEHAEEGLEAPILRLPDDIIQLIFENLPSNAHHIHTLSLVSHRFLYISHSPTLWARLYLSMPGWRLSDSAVRYGIAVDDPPRGTWQGTAWMPSPQRALVHLPDDKSGSLQIPIHFPTLYRSRLYLSKNRIRPTSEHPPQQISFDVHKESVYCVRPVGRWIITGSRDKSMTIWLLKDSDDMGQLNSESLKKVISVPDAHAGSVLSLGADLREDGRGTIITGSSDNTVKVWDVDLSLTEGEAKVELLQTLEGHTAGVLDVILAEKYIISASKDKTIRIYSRKTLELKHEICAHSLSVNGIAISPDGKSFASASVDETWRIWDMETGAEIGGSHETASGPKLTCIAWKGDYIVVGDASQNVLVYKASTGQLLRKCRGHSGLVRSVAIDLEEGFIVSGGYDGSIRMWDLETGLHIRRFIPKYKSLQDFYDLRMTGDPPPPEYFFDIQITPNRIYAARSDGTIVIITVVTDLPYINLMMPL